MSCPSFKSFSASEIKSIFLSMTYSVFHDLDPSLPLQSYLLHFVKCDLATMNWHTTLNIYDPSTGHSLCLKWPTHFAKLTPNSLTHLRKFLNQVVELIFLWARYTLYMSLSSVHHTALYLFTYSFPLYWGFLKGRDDEWSIPIPSTWEFKKYLLNESCLRMMQTLS